MAAILTAAQTELIQSLQDEEIPVKLRCAIDSKLAVNAFRLPCCEQAICEYCHSNLQSSCPVCEHTPLAGADCKPNKTLRTTIKVFLRTEEKKRESLRLKDDSNTFSVTPLEAHIPLLQVPPILAQPTEEPRLAEVDPIGLVTEQAVEPAAAATAIEDQQDVPQQSIEEIAPGQESSADADIEDGDANHGGESKGETSQNADEGSGVLQGVGVGVGFGLDPSAAATFANMPFGGDMNQLQMMMAMQNNINPMGYPGFMGMPGMTMDPMMQSMMMNGGYGGMNCFGMDMGVGGFNGGVAGFNNGYGGQQSWNIGQGQDNFNHPNASGMGQGDYGANNSGYSSHAGAYNQGNYGRSNHYNDYPNSHSGANGFRGRGGRGRGGYGRGGSGYGQSFQEPFSHQIPQQFGQQEVIPGSESGSTAVTKPDPASGVDEFGREIRHKSEVQEGTPSKTADENAVQEPVQSAVSSVPEAAMEEDGADEFSAGTNIAMPIQTLDNLSDPYSQNGGYTGRNAYSQGSYGARRGNFSSMQGPIVKTADIPINAPTGPKAMREAQALPNTSLSNLRRGGFPVTYGQTAKSSGSASASIAPEATENELDERDLGASRSRSIHEDEAVREGSQSREKSRERERKRSRSREHRSKYRGNSHTPTKDDQETERRRERRREQRRRRDEERGRRVDDDQNALVGEDENGNDKDEGNVEDIANERSRSESPSESKRSGHRSRKDKDKYRERERESDREHKSSSHRRRSHREPSRSRGDRDRERGERDRDRERDREHRHERHSRRHSPAPDEAERSTTKKDDALHDSPRTTNDHESSSRKVSVANGDSANGIEIRGVAGSRRRSVVVEDIRINIPTGPRGDRDIKESRHEPLSATSRTSEREREKEKSSRSSRHEHHPSSSRHESSRHESSRKDRDTDRDHDREPPKTKDPHELEREARNRERLLKEAQRIAGLTSAATSAGFGVRKRSRDDGDEVVNGKRMRGKKGRRSGGGGEDEESRIARLEAEREGTRWR